MHLQHLEKYPLLILSILLFKGLQSIEILARILIHLRYYFKHFKVKHFKHFIDQTMNLSIKMKTAERISVCLLNIWASF